MSFKTPLDEITKQVGEVRREASRSKSRNTADCRGWGDAGALVKEIDG